MSTKSGLLSIVCVQLGSQNCLLYGVARCPLLRGCLSIEVNGRQSGHLELSVISWVSAVEGCLLAGFHCNTQIMKQQVVQWCNLFNLL